MAKTMKNFKRGFFKLESPKSGNRIFISTNTSSLSSYINIKLLENSEAKRKKKREINHLFQASLSGLKHRYS